MYYSNNAEFSTFDADHDNWPAVNCADEYGGGFWRDEWDCGLQNINGHYSGREYIKYKLIGWSEHYNLKKSQMMIRPAGKN